MSKQITMLNGETHAQDWLVQQAIEDDFYYGYLGKVAFSSSNLKKLLDSPRTYYNLNFSWIPPVETQYLASSINVCVSKNIASSVKFPGSRG